MLLHVHTQQDFSPYGAYSGVTVATLLYDRFTGAIRSRRRSLVIIIRRSYRNQDVWSGITIQNFIVAGGGPSPTFVVDRSQLLRSCLLPFGFGLNVRNHRLPRKSLLPENFFFLFLSFLFPAAKLSNEDTHAYECETKSNEDLEQYVCGNSSRSLQLSALCGRRIGGGAAAITVSMLFVVHEPHSGHEKRAIIADGFQVVVEVVEHLITYTMNFLEKTDEIAEWIAYN